LTGLQVALVFAFSHRGPLRPLQRLNTALVLPRRVAEELQALTDPTLLALGHPRGFSALWLQPTDPPPVEVNWKQPPQWLSLDTNKLGRAFLDHAHSNVTSLHGLVFRAPPPVLPNFPPPAVLPLRTASTLRVTDALTGRALGRRPELPSWPATDLLLPSEVRVVVDGRGLVVSAILESASGSKEADAFAVQAAREVRFAPDPTPARDTLTLGRLVFEWHAVPPNTDPPPRT
jgi:TonB family protein